MAEKKKGKVKKAEIAERVKKLRAELGDLTQEQFADRLGLARAAVSQWEAESREPTPEAYLKLGMAAKESDTRRWFWQQSGFDVDKLLLAAAQELKSPLESLAEPLVGPIPSGARIYKVDESVAGAFAPGDVFLLEPAADPQDPKPLWGQLVLVKFEGKAPSDWMGWTDDLYVGRLRYAPYTPHLGRILYYQASLIPLNESEARYGVPVVGGWTHAGPPKEPVPGSAREVAQQEVGIARARRQELWERAAQRGGAIMEEGELAEAGRLRAEAETRLGYAEQAEMEEAVKEAKLQAPEKIKLYPGALILGRVIAWFPTRKGKA